MYRYAGCERWTGAIRCRRASLARDSAVAVVVITGEARCCCRSCCRRLAVSAWPSTRLAPSSCWCSCGESAPRRSLRAGRRWAVGPLDFQHATGEPAPLPIREPLPGVLAALLGTVHRRTREIDMSGLGALARSSVWPVVRGADPGSGPGFGTTGGGGPRREESSVVSWAGSCKPSHRSDGAGVDGGLGRSPRGARNRELQDCAVRAPARPHPRGRACRREGPDSQ